jgi:N-acetylmuramoyl-L-alanine amidase
MKILIDNGHGENTPGKRSPDGSLREYAYAREIADRIAHELSARGYDAERIVREAVDVPLSERARRVNEVCGRYGTANVVLVSIHCNAAGNGAEWMNARGWSAYTSKGKTKADKLATFLYEEAEKTEADNITAYAAEWKELYEKKEKRVVELDAKIDHLYAEITKYRDAIRELSEKNSELAVQNQALEFRKCNKHGCADRVPPSEY